MTKDGNGEDPRLSAARGSAYSPKVLAALEARRKKAERREEKRRRRELKMKARQEKADRKAAAKRAKQDAQQYQDKGK